MVGIAADCGVDGASPTGCDDAGNFPIVENVAEEFVSPVKGTRLGGESGDEAVALVGDAGAALGIGLVGILKGGGFAGDEGVLTIVDGMGVGVGEAEIGSAGHAAVDRNSCAVVEAGGGALEFIDFAELGDGAAEWIDAGREWARQRLRVLPGGEGIDGVEAVLKDGAGGIEDGIGESDGRRKVNVESADEVFAVDVEIGDGDGGVVGDFALEREAGLLHARGDEVGGESGNIVGDALGKSSREIAGSGSEWTGDERVGIGGKDLVIVVVGIVEKKLSV